MMEDFILFLCDEWTEENTKHFEEQNKIFEFWTHENVRKGNLKEYEYPALAEFLINKIKEKAN